MPATGPDFISFQVRDLDASQAFYEQYLGLVRSPAGPPHAVVFETTAEATPPLSRHARPPPP
jgi:catechol 2,3-dioxygenase-like lactoylglutathione lyase family enzyme